MAIAPIDLQAIYVNMDNVAKTVANQQQGAQLAQQLQESQMIQKNAEKASAVQKTADNEAKSETIKNEGHASNFYSQEQRRQKQDNDSKEKEKAVEIRESYLGQHINIER